LHQEQQKEEGIAAKWEFMFCFASIYRHAADGIFGFLQGNRNPPAPW
jgi:hypothetical protein